MYRYRTIVVYGLFITFIETLKTLNSISVEYFVLKKKKKNTNVILDFTFDK